MRADHDGGWAGLKECSWQVRRILERDPWCKRARLAGAVLFVSSRRSTAMGSIALHGTEPCQGWTRLPTGIVALVLRSSALWENGSKPVAGRQPVAKSLDGPGVARISIGTRNGIRCSRLSCLSMDILRSCANAPCSFSRLYPVQSPVPRICTNRTIPFRCRLIRAVSTWKRPPSRLWKLRLNPMAMSLDCEGRTRMHPSACSSSCFAFLKRRL